MQPNSRDARIAGAAYFLLFPAPFYLIYVPAKLIVSRDAAATAARILGAEMMFRLAIVAELFVAVGWIFLAMALFRLFKDVDRMQAWLMVILGAVVCAPAALFGAATHLATLTLLHGSSALSGFTTPQLQSLAMLFLRFHGQGILAQQVFWGLWLFPFGLLAIRSGFIPKIFGILLIINGCAYLIVSLIGILFPLYLPIVNQWALLPETGELWIVLWLLIRGVRVEPLPQPAVV